MANVVTELVGSKVAGLGTWGAGRKEAGPKARSQVPGCWGRHDQSPIGVKAWYLYVM
jgi:hypothetical protein